MHPFSGIEFSIVTEGSENENFCLYFMKQVIFRIKAMSGCIRVFKEKLIQQIFALEPLCSTVGA
jgi:hypothetical protein